MQKKHIAVTTGIAIASTTVVWLIWAFGSGYIGSVGRVLLYDEVGGVKDLYVHKMGATCYVEPYGSSGETVLHHDGYQTPSN